MPTALKSAFIAALFAAFVSTVAAAKPEWPQFRGPAGDGISTAKDIPTTWSETENVAWKTPLPGKGHSSPVIGVDQIWMTAALDEPITAEERARRLKSNTGDQPLQVSGRLIMRALCVERSTGKLIHDIELMTDAEPQPTHAMNSYASPTPVLEEGRLYCHFGTHGTACVDTNSGKVLWTNREHRIQHENGAGSSPVLVGKLLVFHCDGSDKQYITALNKETGETVWKTDRTGEMNSNPQLKKAYGTPLVIYLESGPQLISTGADWLYVYDAATGREISKTSYQAQGFSIVPLPLYAHGMVFMSTSFMKAEILAFKYDGLRTPEIAWRFGKQAPSMSSPIIVGNELFMVGDQGVATCLDAKSGDVVWTHRLQGNFAASPLFADGKLLFCSREGKTFVVKPGPKFELLATNQLDGAHLASPVAVGESLYLRTDKALYCIRQLSGSK